MSQKPDNSSHGVYADGKSLSVTAFIWTVAEGNSVTTITDYGMAMGLAPGDATIVATGRNVSGSAALSVEAGPAAGWRWRIRSRIPDPEEWMKRSDSARRSTRRNAIWTPRWKGGRPRPTLCPP